MQQAGCNVLPKHLALLKPHHKRIHHQGCTTYCKGWECTQRSFSFLNRWASSMKKTWPLNCLKAWLKIEVMLGTKPWNFLRVLDVGTSHGSQITADYSRKMEHVTQLAHPVGNIRREAQLPSAKHITTRRTKGEHSHQVVWAASLPACKKIPCILLQPPKSTQLQPLLEWHCSFVICLWQYDVHHRLSYTSSVCLVWTPSPHHIAARLASYRTE